ncbi:hypothetical protein PVK62_07910 [Aliivibrio sp. S3MY1]|uniref:hypothetical protein n=1 Tax=unclassified Aliivibrio TaxID=2645654 RepID=UPI002378100D|nr:MULTISPECIES: hypothetical protein [unclassified Aliivibrio]MDD9176026.1 hypothetical protein [Aliivibrio sp. S3TY1]MDD9193059.1 hypothetical protein [Aliivibrio sp. S2TY2]MDD9195763.1 hypothetical protein [Aliivibrio sp. S3MY1]
MDNIVQHYGAWLKIHARELGRNRANTLSIHGFTAIPYILETWSHGSPIKYAKELATKIVESGEFDCDSVHLVLLDCKSIEGSTGYQVYRKLIKANK